ncbi:hypothetical protein DACRYDRAFT_25298, partial [Dacryopinax primogenitus]
MLVDPFVLLHSVVMCLLVFLVLLNRLCLLVWAFARIPIDRILLQFTGLETCICSIEPFLGIPLIVDWSLGCSWSPALWIRYPSSTVPNENVSRIGCAKIGVEI